MAIEVCWRTILCNMNLSDNFAGDELGEYFEAFCDEYTLRADVKGKGRDRTQWSTDPKRSKLWQKCCNVSGFGKYKTLCVTGRGYLANADVGVRPGDRICIHGGKIPFVIRPDEHDETYQLVRRSLCSRLHARRRI